MDTLIVHGWLFNVTVFTAYSIIVRLDADEVRKHQEMFLKSVCSPLTIDCCIGMGRHLWPQISLHDWDPGRQHSCHTFGPSYLGSWQGCTSPQSIF